MTAIQTKTIEIESPAGFWDDAEILHSYSRQQAVEDGVLVDVSAQFPELIANAGIKYPVAMTRAAFAQYVELTPAAVRAMNDITGRMWDVLWMFRHAAKKAQGDQFLFRFYCVTKRVRPSACTLKAVCGPGDNFEPVITLMLPDED